MVELPACSPPAARLARWNRDGRDRAPWTAEAAARAAFEAAAALTPRARGGASGCELAVTAELPPLRLDRARFVVRVAPLAGARWGAQGAEQAAFLIATNPGQAPGRWTGSPPAASCRG